MNENLGDRLARSIAAAARADHADLVRDTVRRLAQERDLGHVCLSLDDHAGSPRRDDGDGGDFPDPANWGRSVLARGVVESAAENAGARPLILASNRLYLLRDHAAERGILDGLRARLQAEPVTAPEAVGAALARLGHLPDVADKPDWQLAALVAGASCRFLLLTGGPGTGKTTTIARLLAALVTIDPDKRIALCAPTGKAAARLGAAIAEQAQQDDVLHRALPRLPTQTLHRLLRYQPLDDSFYFGRHHRLPLDLVVVDEASMLDPALLAALFAALHEDAQLVLVGDRDQLAAVAAGQVLGDLSRAARPESGVGPRLAELVADATGMRLPVQDDASAIANAVVALRDNHRFGAQPGLDHFARALAQRDAARALQVLDDDHADLEHASDADAVLDEITPELLAAVRAEPDEAIARLDRQRVLSATRHGSNGATAWNRRIEDRLRRHDVPVDDPWYPGRPILITTNDHQNRIYNGDLGVVCRDADGRPQVAFPRADGGVNTISIFRLPAHETAWAITVHKAQGSEFDTIVLSMPDGDSPLWQAPLIYTGITRARRRAILIAERERLMTALGHWPTRSSGLADALGPT